jgi:hypothetical protein
MKFTAIPITDYKPTYQAISGYRLDDERVESFTVRLDMGVNTRWISSKRYATYEAAKRAAARQNKKYADT